MASDLGQPEVALVFFMIVVVSPVVQEMLQEALKTPGSIATACVGSAAIKRRR